MQPTTVSCRYFYVSGGAGGLSSKCSPWAILPTDFTGTLEFGAAVELIPSDWSSRQLTVNITGPHSSLPLSSCTSAPLPAADDAITSQDIACSVCFITHAHILYCICCYYYCIWFFSYFLIPVILSFHYCFFIFVFLVLPHQ